MCFAAAKCRPVADPLFCPLLRTGPTRLFRMVELVPRTILRAAGTPQRGRNATEGQERHGGAGTPRRAFPTERWRPGVPYRVRWHAQRAAMGVVFRPATPFAVAQGRATQRTECRNAAEGVPYRGGGREFPTELAAGRFPNRSGPQTPFAERVRLKRGGRASGGRLESPRAIGEDS